MNEVDKKASLVQCLHELIADVERAETVSAFINVDHTVGSNMLTTTIKIVATGVQ